MAVKNPEDIKDEPLQAPTGGFGSALKRFWFYLKEMNVGVKYNTIELLTKHRKFLVQGI